MKRKNPLRMKVVRISTTSCRQMYFFDKNLYSKQVAKRGKSLITLERKVLNATNAKLFISALKMCV